MYHPSFNIGIEEEYQLIDPESWELIGYVTQTMGGAQVIAQERKPGLEFAGHLQNAVLAVGAPVCADIKAARDHLVRMRGTMLELAAAHRFKVAAAGTHPFSSWEKSSLPTSHYRVLANDAEMIARRMLAFGMHVHIGVEDREMAVDVMNTMRYVLPHILTLTTSSPFWAGRNTGLKSYRNVLLDALPRTGIPGLFQGYQEFHSYVDTLVRTNSISDVSRIWYDILPHHRYPTLYVRICDMVPDYRDALAVTALLQAVVAWMVHLRRNNMSFRIYERLLIEENKWRAVRYGLDGNLIDFGIEKEVPTRDLIRELLELVAPQAGKLNVEDELAHIHTILERGASADQQLRVWRDADRDFAAVVKYLVQETENIP
jgi:carboxylate-amine ligase